MFEIFIIGVDQLFTPGTTLLLSQEEVSLPFLGLFNTVTVKGMDFRSVSSLSEGLCGKYCEKQINKYTGKLTCMEKTHKTTSRAVENR